MKKSLFVLFFSTIVCVANSFCQCNTKLSAIGNAHWKAAETLYVMATSVADYEQIAEEYEKVLETDPKHASTYLKLGRLYTKWGNESGDVAFDKAEYYFKKCKEVCEDSSEVADVELVLLEALRKKYAKGPSRFAGIWGFCEDDEFEPIVDVAYDGKKYTFHYIREKFSDEVILEQSETPTELKFTSVVTMDLREKAKKEKVLGYRGNCNSNADRGYPTTGQYFFNKRVLKSTIAYSVDDNSVVQKGLSYHVDYYYNGVLKYAETVNNWGRVWELVNQKDCSYEDEDSEVYFTRNDDDSVTVMLGFLLEQPIVSFLKDEIETEPTSISEDFFNVPMRPTWKGRDGSTNWLVVRLPKQYNYFLIKVVDPWDTSRWYIACISTTKDVSALLPTFDRYKYYDRKEKRMRYQDTIHDNTMETYHKAQKLERDGKYREANKLYEEAADGGNVLAMQQLAENYRNGKGCMRNTKKAYHWYELAAAFGDAYSAAMIDGDSYRKKSTYSVMGGR